MMKMLYSDYTIEKVRKDLGKLKEESQKAEQLGEISRVEILKSKIQMVASYMMNPSDFVPGNVHELNGDPDHTFKINFIDGMMAWGHRINLLGETYEKEEALPISLLGDLVKDSE